jgi:hypothetical protein
MRIGRIDWTYGRAAVHDFFWFLKIVAPGSHFHFRHRREVYEKSVTNPGEHP